MPPAVVAEITAAVAAVAPGLNRYPDREFTDLRRPSRHTSRAADRRSSPEQVWAGNGSNEVLLHLLQAFGGPGRTALGFTPAYSMHPIITATTGTRGSTGCAGRRAEEPFDLAGESAVAQVRAARPRRRLPLLAEQPDRHGARPRRGRGGARRRAERAVVVVDEAYAEFARPGTPSALTLLDGRPRLVVTRTMSKAFAFAGGRLGYLAADPALVDALRLVRMPYHLSTRPRRSRWPRCGTPTAMLATVDVIKDQRDRIVGELAGLGLDPVPSDANFVLFGGLADAHATWPALLDRGVLVRDVGIPHYLRVTAGTPAGDRPVPRRPGIARPAQTHRTGARP